MRLRLVIAVLVLSGAVLATAMSMADTRAQACESRFLSHVALLRTSNGLEPLRVDADRRDLIALRFRLALEEEGRKFLEGQQASDLLDWLITDWDRWCFVETGHDPRDVLQKIEADSGFAATVLRPDVTSIAVAAGELDDGQVWCAGCVTRRLVIIDNWFGDFSPLGPSYVTARGTSAYRNLKVRFYKGEEDPLRYHGEDREIDFNTDAEGHFEVTIPISVFGSGDYQIIIYVLDSESGTAEIAVHTRCRVPEEPIW